MHFFFYSYAHWLKMEENRVHILFHTIKEENNSLKSHKSFILVLKSTYPNVQAVIPVSAVWVIFTEYMYAANVVYASGYLYI